MANFIVGAAAAGRDSWRPGLGSLCLLRYQSSESVIQPAISVGEFLTRIIKPLGGRLLLVLSLCKHAVHFSRLRTTCAETGFYHRARRKDVMKAFFRQGELGDGQ